MPTYIEIASDLNPDFYIRSLSKLILQLSGSFDFIVKVMKLLYGKPKANNYHFAIYHPYCKEKPGIESIDNSFLFQPPPKLLSPNLVLQRIIIINKGTIRLEEWIKQ